ncbi:MAG: hypothetical protein KKA79_01190 [Nanoarchaeota archaeon]|nr:hypothetical protein [Nanoarchaeota archaeon]
MKFPYTFRPEKNLEDKTQQLIDEPKIKKNLSQLVKQEYLDELIHEIDESIKHIDYDIVFSLSSIYDKVDWLIGEAGYEEVPSANDKVKYWACDDPLNNSLKYMLIQKDFNIGARHYDFAMFEKSKFEQVHNKINDYYKWEYYVENDYQINTDLFKPCGRIGKTIGTLGGYIASNLVSGQPFYSFNPSSLISAVAGGVCGGALIAILFHIPFYFLGKSVVKKCHKKKGKDLNFLCDIFETDNRGALINAFT